MSKIPRSRLWIACAILTVVAAPQVAYSLSYDNNQRSMEVSLYGKGTVAGDTALKVSPNGDLYVTLQASSSTIGTVAQGASTSLPWPAMITNGSGTQQGTATSPLRTDPTGTTTQPVSGTVTANIGASASLPIFVTNVSADAQSVTEDWRTPTDTAAVSVGTTATALLAATPAKMVGVCLQPTDGNIWIGGASVTSSTGMQVNNLERVCLDAFNGGALYGIATPSAVSTRVLPFSSL